jgi:uncharacterized protein with von Willebrand factor type A (vWA) domain
MHFAENLMLFVRTLRAQGVPVPADATLDAIRALEHVGIRRRNDVRDALRAVLINRYDDLARFDRLFDQFWRVWSRPGGSGLPQPIQPPRRGTSKVQWLAATSVPPDEYGGGGQQDTPDAVRTYSAADVWRTKDFATYDAAEMAQARAVIARLAWTPGVRVTRRWVLGGGAVDLRRLLRVNARHGGEPLVIPRRQRRLAPRPLVLICDVSGSMEPYTRMLLLFAHAIARRRRSVELFVFSTRLTRITRQFAGRPIDAALSRARDLVRDWSGGTRIGQALRTFHAEWGRRVLRRGPVVVLISDGWDLGDPDLLKAEIARLHRGCFRLIWLNPLIGSPGYEPLTRGMRAALPHVDDFLSVRNLASLEALAAHLEALPDRRGGRARKTPDATSEEGRGGAQVAPWK